MKETNESTLSLLDKNIKAIPILCGSAPPYDNGVLFPISQIGSLFKYPPDFCLAADKNLYISKGIQKKHILSNW